MISIQLVDGLIDLLPHRARQLWIARRGQAFDALLLQARAQLGLAAAFLAVALVTLRQVAMERAIMFASRGREEARDAYIHAHHRRVRRSLEWNLLFVGEGEPPAVWF